MALKTYSLTELQREITRREKGGKKLLAQREKVSKQLDALDTALAELGVKPGRHASLKPARGRPRKASGAKPGRRSKNAVSLPESIAAAMDVGAVVSPKEAAELVLTNGYKTNSKTFNIQVSQALTKDARFKRVERGQYQRVK